MYLHCLYVIKIKISFVLTRINKNNKIKRIIIHYGGYAMAQHYETVLNHYQFTSQDSDVLMSLKQRMQPLREEFIDGFYDYIWKFGETATFLKNKDIISYHREKIQEWFINLFSGQYDMNYFIYLYKIGEVHVKIGLPTHYVNAAFTYVRTFISKQLQSDCSDREKLLKELQAVEKIIDINLDVLTSSYREEELSKYLSMSKGERKILIGLKYFTSYTNLLLASALALVAIFAVSLFAYDVYNLFFSSEKIQKGILTVFGSLLILWASIELIHEEIKHLQGDGFAIGTFIMLAMAALIRKILIYSLSPSKMHELLIIGLVTVGLAISYWLVGINKRTVID